MDILPGLFSEDQVAERFRVSVRVVRENARKMNVGRKFARKRYLTEDEMLEMMKGGSPCSGFSSGRGRRSGTSGGRSPDKPSTRLQRKETKAMLDGLRGNSKPSSPDQPTKNVTPLRSKTPPLST